MAKSNKILLMLTAVVLCCEFPIAQSKKQPTNAFKAYRVIGGKPAKIEDVPYQVSIIYQDEHICGGAIVNNRFIITAAFCISMRLVQHIKVRAGSATRQRGGVVIDAKRIVKHELYDGIDYDIGFVELNEPLKFGPNVESISLVKHNRPGDLELDIGDSVEISGWGITSETGRESDTLQKITVSIVDWKECKRSYVDIHEVTKRMFCAGNNEGGNGPCVGDVGGPVVLDGELVGLVSWGGGCARETYPSVSVRIAALRNWWDEHAVSIN